MGDSTLPLSAQLWPAQSSRGLPSDTGTGTVFQGAGPALGSLGAAGRGSHVPCHLLAALSEAELMKHLTLMF